MRNGVKGWEMEGNAEPRREGKVFQCSLCFPPSKAIKPIHFLQVGSRIFLPSSPFPRIFYILIFPLSPSSHTFSRSFLAPVPTSIKIFLVMIWFQTPLGKNLPAELIHLTSEPSSRQVKMQINPPVHGFFCELPTPAPCLYEAFANLSLV